MNDQRTIQSAWENGGNRVNNFDAIRFFAAAAVVLSHSFEITGGPEAFEPLRALTDGQASLGRAAVLVFFALSGFLIVKSWRADPRLGAFIVKRGLRIAPALWCVVLISLVVIGPLFTTAGLLPYLQDAQTGQYLANAFLYTKFYSLPGVFSDLPLQGVVNGPLWTLKFEVLCYGLVAVLGMAGLLSRAICLVMIALAYGVHILGGGETHSGGSYYLFAGADLMRGFFVGAAAALFADKVVLDDRLALSAGIGLFAAAILGVFDAAFPLLGGYLVFYVGFARAGRLARFGKHGDFSYGIYVWGFPLQQITMAMTGIAVWYVNFALAFPLTLAAAYLSWRYVEAPSLRLKSNLLGNRRRQSASRLKQART